MNLNEDQQDLKIDSDAMIPIICELLSQMEDAEDVVLLARKIYNAYLENYRNL
jgi:hypothetical protein